MRRGADRSWAVVAVTKGELSGSVANYAGHWNRVFVAPLEPTN
jgi:hypothetical protein